ncbi:MAG: MM0924 family protein [Acidobacteriota bacterium]
MEEILKGLIGKKIDVNCGSNVVYRGEVISVSAGVLMITNEEGHDVYISTDKIAALTECKDFGSRPGFIV